MKTENEVTHLMQQLANGYLPVRYRGVFQQFLLKRNVQLLRAAHYADLLERNVKNPIARVIRELKTSQSTVYRDYQTYKNLFKK